MATLPLIDPPRSSTWVKTEVAQTSSPVVLDSPHSGTVYPADFAFTCPKADLRQAEDTHVERLFSDAPSLGAPLVHALFPRSYIDPNRHIGEIDTALLTETWPGEIRPSDKARIGMGLVWRVLDEGTPIYATPLTAQAVQARIAACYAPYHTAVQAALDAAHAEHGKALLVNCHSMPTRSARLTAEYGVDECADFVLGDRDGSTCSPAITEAASAYLRAQGYQVAVNFPYKGVELVRKHGQPTAGRHALQVEINRKLYMNEITRELNTDVADVQAVLRGLVETLIAASYTLNEFKGE